MSTKETEQTIALAAIFQAAELVAGLAKSGQIENRHLEPLVSSILMVNASKTVDIYGGEWDYQSNLSLGKNTVHKALSKDRASVNPETLRYALSLIHLESKLAKSPDMLKSIGSKISVIEQKKDMYDSVLHENMIAAISGMYQDTLSTLSFRIQVRGESRFLQQPHTANQVRAALMAGVRAAMLWRQLGGKRWHLIFKRKALINALK
ncbi:high frequency lysogenization protein HflD [Marinomonas sp. C2222]|uniref:High frequency lysogenization protein HflD homolog n=1 Tax=Marinomonas sargassi TaxID=2984494 RepID=A0ABT2YNI6_9GAMM|nr:high frequency lysogenization protein HflD [Marinomonas sargassi]MCV2401315.1 high frequency lysogenization protein HflD [Marinomonas sargassi]